MMKETRTNMNWVAFEKALLKYIFLNLKIPMKFRRKCGNIFPIESKAKKSYFDTLQS